jgi:hypothetical protein
VPGEAERHCANLTDTLIAALRRCDRRALLTLFGMAPHEVADEPEPPARRGVKLGGYRAGAKLTAKARQAGTAARVERANKMAADYARVIAELQAAGAASLRAIAAALSVCGRSQRR